MTSMLLCVFIIGALGSVQEDTCSGDQCNPIQGDENMLLQSKARISKMDLVEGMDKDDVVTGRGGGEKKCEWVNMNKGLMSQSSTCWGGVANRATDGDADTNIRNGKCTHTCKDGSVQWLKWTTDFSVDVKKVEISVADGKWYGRRLHGMEIYVSGQKCATEDGTLASGETKEFSCEGSGTDVELRQPNKDYVSVCELKVYACYVPADYSYTIDPVEARASQFLMKATYGPTRASIQELKEGGSYKDWIKKQMALPVESHRKYFRERVNPAFDSTTMNEQSHSHSGREGFELNGKSPCAEGSRWINYVFTKPDIGKEVTVKNGKLFVGGVFRSDIDSNKPNTCSDLQDSWLKGRNYACKDGRALGYVAPRCDDDWFMKGNYCQQTCFDIGNGRQGDDCSGGWSTIKSAKICKVWPFMGGKISLGEVQSSLLETGANESGGPKPSGYDPCAKNLMHMVNPVAYMSGAVKETSLTFETSPQVPDAIFLAAGSPKQCELLSTEAIKYKGKVYLRDTRLELFDNEVNTPTKCAPRTYLNADGCKVNPKGSKCDLSCGTPYEVANIGTYGHQFEYRFFDFNDVPVDKKYDNKYIAHPYSNKQQPNIIWGLHALHAKDQLRQRMAWALAQITVTSQKGYGASETETWVYFYDIFVRHAFGNFRDILQEVTNSPVMGGYLTYTDSGSYDESKSYPDENYAREIMQLFTIGLEELNEDGSVKTDAKGEAVETYTNEHIMNFARIMTGYRKRGFRWNYERKYKGGGDNNIDAMWMYARRHDKYPKPTFDGNYIGDLKPLCPDLATQAFLAKDARYEFAGYDAKDKPFLEIDSSSALFAKLCPGGAGSCKFAGHVVLDEALTCMGTECSANSVEIVKVDSAYYEYVQPTCVYMFFSLKKKLQHATKWWDKCAFEDTPAGGVACCDGCTDKANSWMKRKKITCQNAEQKWNKRGTPWMFSRYCAKNKGWRKHKYCEMTCFENSPKWGNKLAYQDSDCSKGAYREEKKCSTKQDTVSYGAAQEFCKSKGLSLCEKRPQEKCGESDMYLWTETACEVKVTVHEDGKVSGLTNYAEANKFSVQWMGDKAPTGEYVIDISTTKVFSDVPTEDELHKKLKIGAFPPNIPATKGNGEIKAYAPSGEIDENTIFECAGKYYKNAESVVILSDDHQFRNPPAFLRPNSGVSSGREARAALAEVDTFLDYLFHHPNTPVFIGKKLIQRFETSNPSAQYMKAVVQAFKDGTYEGVGSGEYGDLGATLAAILLFPTTTPMAQKTDGLLREPLLKIMHMLRSMEFSDNYPVRLGSLFSKIGQQPYASPTVFNFYEATYSPPDFGAEGMNPSRQLDSHEHALLAPEFQIFTPPWTISLLNGLMQFIKNGLSHCHGGFTDYEGGWYMDAHPGCKRGEIGLKEQSTPQETLRILDLLLTGGRLTSMDAALVANAYDNGRIGEKMLAAERAIVFTPEFNTLGDPKPKGVRPAETFKSHTAKASYKALVNMFFHGGADTYQMLVPRDCKLYDDYASARKGMELNMKTLLPIRAKTQVCKNFGLHPKLTSLQSLYNSGELAFIANVGTLKRSTTRGELKGGGYKVCPSQFSHSHAQAAVQTLHCQQLTSAKGLGGKIADVLEKKFNLKSSSFSLSGRNRWSQGVQTHIDVLDPDDGVKTLDDYDETKPLMMNVTGEIYENIYCEEYGTQLKQAVLRSQELSGQLVGASDAIKDYAAGGKLSNQFKQVARAIASRKERQAERDFFMVQLGGFDTHSGVVEVLDEKFATISKAVDEFVKNMKDQGIWDSVVITTESDFGRTLTFNGRGSDHGWGGNHFILGGSVKGGQIYNEFLETYQPGNDYDAGRGRVIPKYPWESFYAPVAEWMGVDKEDLEEILPNLKSFNSSMIIEKSALFK